MESKRRKIILYLIPAIIIISFICLINYWNHCVYAKPDSDDPKIIALYDANNNLNELLCDKHFGDIFNMLMKSKMNNMRPKGFYSDKRGFIRDHYECYAWALIRRKMVSYTISEDIAKTINEVMTRHAIFLNYSSKRISYNYWIYNTNQWYLIDYDTEDTTCWRPRK